MGAGGLTTTLSSLADSCVPRAELVSELADSAAPRRAAAANAVVNSNFALQMREGAAVIKAPAPSGAEVATQASQSSSPCKID